MRSYTFTFKASTMFVLLLSVLGLLLSAATFPPAQASISQPRVAAPTLYYGVHDIFTAPKIINMNLLRSHNVAHTDSTSLAELYPDDVYVNWVNVDLYQFSVVGAPLWGLRVEVFSSMISSAQ